MTTFLEDRDLLMEQPATAFPDGWPSETHYLAAASVAAGATLGRFLERETDPERRAGIERDMELIRRQSWKLVQDDEAQDLRDMTQRG